MGLKLKEANRLADLKFPQLQSFRELLKSGTPAGFRYLRQYQVTARDVRREYGRRLEQQAQQRRLAKESRRAVAANRREAAVHKASSRVTPSFDSKRAVVVHKSSAVTVFRGSNAAATRRYYRELEEKGYDGRLAAQLMRVQKASSRAKQYRGDYVDYAYQNKANGMTRLTELLSLADCRHRWGWGTDDVGAEMHGCGHVLYVDLPTGQVSFHATERLSGPEYAGEWDGKLNASESRIIRFCELVERH